MLQHRPQENQEVGTDARLQTYLKELEKPMHSLGETERQEWRAEAQEHLESLITAYEELGETREEAIRSAMARFGEPKTIGFRMRMAELKKTARLNPESQVTKYVLSCCALFFIPALLSFLTFVILYNYTDNLSAQWIARNITGALLILGPFLSGWQLGRRLPWLRREIRRVHQVHGKSGTLRLRFGLTVMAVASSFELALFWSLIRIFSAEGPTHLIATDWLPALAWVPITLGTAYWRGRWATDTTDTDGNTTPA